MANHEETVIHVRELNPDLIHPPNHKISDPDQGGPKLAVIGKPGCFAKNTPIRLFDGTTKPVQDVVVGDVLMGDDSTPRVVLELCRGEDDMFKISKKNESYTVNSKHKLVLKNEGFTIEIPVCEYIQKSDNWKQGWKIFKTAVEYTHQDTPIPAYTLGRFLGGDNEYADDILPLFDDLDTKDNIPDIYKHNSFHVRLDILAGLIDAKSNCLNEKLYEFTDTNHKLVKSMYEVAHSLALPTTIQTTTTADTKVYSRLTLKGKLPVKLSPMLEHELDPLEYDFRVTPVGKHDYYGFTVDGNHRFLLSSNDVVRNTGKSTLISALLYAKKHVFPIGMVMSGTEDSTGFYESIMPSSFVYNKLDIEKVKDFVRRQKLAKKHLDNPWGFLLLDDCADDSVTLSQDIFKTFFRNGRHWKNMFIISQQTPTDVKGWVRSNLDGVFILRETSLRNRRILHENYASVVGDFKTFCTLMDALTEDYHAIYINNAAKTNKLEDLVFWWKPTPPPKDFKLGCPEFWQHHYDRHNPDYRPPMI